MSSEKIGSFAEGDRFVTRNTIDIALDGPGDTTVRPCPPERRAQLEKEQEKIRQWDELQRQRKLQGLEPLPLSFDVVIDGDDDGDAALR